MSSIRVAEARPNVGPGGTFGMAFRADASAAPLLGRAWPVDGIAWDAAWGVVESAPDSIFLHLTYGAPVSGTESFRFERHLHEAALAPTASGRSSSPRLRHSLRTICLRGYCLTLFLPDWFLSGSRPRTRGAKSIELCDRRAAGALRAPLRSGHQLIVRDDRRRCTVFVSAAPKNMSACYPTDGKAAIRRP